MSNRTDPQNDLGAELDRRAQRRDAWYGLKGYVHQNGPLLGFDAGEGTKHDPSNGQFTSGGGSSGTGKKLDTARKAMLQHPAGSPGWKAALAEKRKAEGEHYEASKSEFKETGATKYKGNPAREGQIAAGAKGGTPGEQGQIAARNEGGKKPNKYSNPAPKAGSYKGWEHKPLRQGVEPTRVGETQNGHRIGRKRK